MYDYYSMYSNGIIAPSYLRRSQLILYNKLRTEKKVVTNCHRRWGKGTTVFTYSFEQALSHCIEDMPNNTPFIIRYGTDTQLHAYSIFDYLTSKIFDKAPSLKPKSKRGGSYFEFENSGARVYLFGMASSQELDKARGEEAHIIILDEFAFWRFKAEYALKSVLMPQLRETNGQLFITSTPAEDLTHHYIDQVSEAKLKGNLFEWTIKDSRDIGEKTDEEVQEIIDECGGESSAHFQREYMCKLIPDPNRLVVPEAQNETLYLVEYTLPSHYDFYVCLDLGLRHYTAALFAYLDFKNSILVVQKEYVTNYTSTGQIVHHCLEIENELLPTDKLPYKRLSDNEMQQLFDMKNDHDYDVMPISKRKKQGNRGFVDSLLNNLRLGIQNRKIIIDPSCVNLLTQLKYGIWNERRTDFQETDSMGHLDALMALAYLYDNIEWNKNPYPYLYEHIPDTTETFVGDQEIKRRTKISLGKMIGK